MKNAAPLRTLCFSIAILLAGCEQPTWDTGGGPSTEQFPGPLRVVQARAQLAGTAVRLDLRNTGDEAMCFWAASFPTREHALGFRVFDADGREKRTGEVLPAGNRVVELDPGQTLSTEVSVRPWFESELQNGECVLFEAVYFPCSEADSFDRTEGTPLAISGLVQSSWLVEAGQLTLIPQPQPSCRTYSSLIRQAP